MVQHQIESIYELLISYYKTRADKEKLSTDLARSKPSRSRTFEKTSALARAYPRGFDDLLHTRHQQE